jgi:hypothetical protein
MKTNRRNFIKTITTVSSGLLLPINTFSFMPKVINNDYSNNELLELSFDLLQTWCNGLLSTQITDPKMVGLHGGVICPACARVHGRVAYAIYPLMFLADKTQNNNYKDAAINLYNWMERSVSFPDGSWVNDTNVNLWKGITVCTAITLAETLMQFGHLLDKNIYEAWKARLIKASDYLYENFNIYTGNINYPATCSYALSLIGEFLNVQKYKDKGRQLGNECKAFFTPKDKLLFGEGNPQDMISPKGCRFVDLGYNVEESLPSLVMYAKLVKDEELLDLLTESLKAHAEFMLPDGAWDNSWGSRSFKWSYWGGTTSDGSQHAYALLADREPEFYQVALQNAKLQKQCTHDNLIYGGLHTKLHGHLPCNHPSFCHVKAMATVLHHADIIKSFELPNKIELPRSKEYGVKYFSEIQTWLVSKNGWKGTITGYDMDYANNAGGHPTGGALCMLWHEITGPLFTASMNRYQLIEAANMQMQTDEIDMPLTPHLELDIEGVKYMNIYDKKATIEYIEDGDNLIFNTKSRLINEKQEDVATGTINCLIKYLFKKDEFIITISHDSENENVKFSVPIISAHNEEIILQNAYKFQLQKPNAKLTFEANVPMNIIKTEKGRIFNFIPGLEAIPLVVSGKSIEIKISVI